MAKLTLNAIGSRYGSIDALNDNSDLIEAALENTLSRDGTGPNEMNANLDMNGYAILNANTDLTDSSSLLTLGDADSRYVNSAGDTMTGTLNTPRHNTNTLYINGVQVVPESIMFAPNASDVQYDPEGTGAVAATVEEKLHEWISPANFGALGDANATGTSGTNDNAAFVLLEAAHTNKLVNLGGKIYLVNSPIPHANQYINGEFVVDSSTTDDQPTNFAIGRGSFLDNTFVPRQFPSSTLNFAAGNFNTAVGKNSMANNTTGRRNTAVGSNAMFTNTTGYYNTALGAYAQFSMTTGNYNVAIGNQCQQFLTFGNSNVAVGNGTMVNMANGDDNTAVGDIALTKTTNRCVAIGKQAAASLTGNDCVAIGYQALSAPTASGLYNVAIGNAAGGSLSTGNSNTAVGRRALAATTTGAGNVALGNDAMVGAGVACTGSNNVAVGNNASPNITSGYENISIGQNAGAALADGFKNSFIGRYAGQATTSGAGNVAIGEQSLSDVTTGNYNTAIGTGTTVGGTDFTNSTVIGYSAVGTASNQVTLGNSSISSFRCQVALTVVSDERDKVRVSETPGLPFINKVDTFVGQWNKRDGSENPSGTYAFLNAQNLETLQKEFNVDLGLVDNTNPEQLAATYERMIPILVRSIQQLSAEVTELRTKLI